MDCERWPVSFSGIDPFFKLSESEQAAIEKIIGENQIDRIICIADSYLIEKKSRSQKTVNELNNGLFEIGTYCDKLIDLLEDKVLLAHLQNKVQNSFNSEELAAKLVENPYSYHPSASILNQLKIMSTVCNLVKKNQKKTGRRSGANIAEYHLIELLYFKCLECTGKRPKNNPKGSLQKLVKVLSKPLGLNNNLSGIVRKVIENHAQKSSQKSITS